MGAAQAAVQLAAAEPWLAATDAWVAGWPGAAPGGPWHGGLDWTWAPGGATSAVAPSGLTAQCAWAGDGAAEGAKMEWPWRLLLRLPPPPAAWCAGVAWQPVAAECVLATLDLSAEDEHALEPGGLLLLPPPPVAGAWPAGLRAAGDANGPGRGVWRDAAGRLVLDPGAQAPEADRRWAVCARLREPLDPGTLLGWHPGGAVGGLSDEIRLVAAQAGASASLQGGRGRLAPWGGGQGMFMDAVDRPNPAAADGC